MQWKEARAPLAQDASSVVRSRLTWNGTPGGVLAYPLRIQGVSQVLPPSLGASRGSQDVPLFLDPTPSHQPMLVFIHQQPGVQ